MGVQFGLGDGYPPYGLFKPCGMCGSVQACAVIGRCASAAAQAQIDGANVLNQQRWQHQSYGLCAACGKIHGSRFDCSVIDLPADAVREVRPVPLLGIDEGSGDVTSVCAARGHEDGTIEIVGICQYTGEADSDGGECD